MQINAQLIYGAIVSLFTKIVWHRNLSRLGNQHLLWFLPNPDEHELPCKSDIMNQSKSDSSFSIFLSFPRQTD